MVPIMKLAMPTTSPEKQPLTHRRRLAGSFILCILIVLLLLVILLAVSFGSTSISIATIAQILLNSTTLFHFAREWDPSVEPIILQYRLPVVIGAALVGAALSLAVVLFHCLFPIPPPHPSFLQHTPLLPP